MASPRKVVVPPPDKSAARVEVESTVAEIRAALRLVIQRANQAKRLTPDVIAAYAALHLRTDDGLPITPADHHWLWLTLMCDERIDKLLIIAPPESAKTTWTISAFVGCYIGIWPERSVMIGSVDGSTAEKRSLSLRAMTESGEWQATFPGVRPVQASGGLKWNTDEWSIAPGGIPRAGRIHPTMVAVGRGGSIVGGRGDLMIGDDLLDMDSTRTVHQRNLNDLWLHSSFLSRKKSRTGRAMLIGTAWHPDDSYMKAKREGGWVTCHTPLLSDSAQVYAFLTYPDDWPYETLGEPMNANADAYDLPLPASH